MIIRQSLEIIIKKFHSSLKFIDPCDDKILSYIYVSQNGLFHKLFLHFVNVLKEFKSFILKNFFIIFIALFFWPLTILFFFNIYIPIKVFYYVISYPHVNLALEISSRKSNLVRKLLIHISALYKVALSIWEQIAHTKASVFLAWALQLCLEIVTVWNDREHRDDLLIVKNNLKDNKLSISDLSELLAYEELEDIYQQDLSKKIMKKVFYDNFIYVNLF